MSVITDTEFTTTVNGQTFTGVMYQATPPQVTGTDAEYDAYVARNTDKSEMVYSLRGIKYATQPKRFKPPVLKVVDGPVDARKFGNVAPQGFSSEGRDYKQGRSDLGVSLSSYDFAARGVREDPDCFNLNFMTKTLPTDAGHPVSGRPTVIRFHGGAGNYGTASDPRLSPHRAAVYGINYIDVEYPLANLGHYYLPDMDLEPDYEGVNFSLLAAGVALDWVLAYGEDLGCDITNITLEGGSFGGNICLCLAVDPAHQNKFQKMWLSSPSAGINERWQKETTSTFIGYDNYFNIRKQAAEVAFTQLRSTVTPTKTLETIKAELITAGATDDEAYAEVMRDHMDWNDFLALDGGGYRWKYPSNTYGYEATRSGTIIKDNETCFHNSNRSAALSGDVTGLHDVVIVVAEDEASVIGGGNQANLGFVRELENLSFETTQQWARSPVYNTEWNAAVATPLWGGYSVLERFYPWGTATEPNRMIFNHGYQHTAYCWARAVEAVGATSYLVWNNFNYSASFGDRVGHTKDEPSWLLNPEWTCLPPAEGELEGLTAADIREADAAAAMHARFVATGDTAGVWPEAIGFDLFETPKTMTLGAFDPALKNWNVWGSFARSATTPTYSLTNQNFFWDHAWDHYDSQVI